MYVYMYACAHTPKQETIPRWFTYTDGAELNEPSGRGAFAKMLSGYTSAPFA